MPPDRDYSEEYRRRQERAREEGYASDYERRMAEAGDSPEEREWARGHRGESFLRDYAEAGDVLMVGDERDAAGRFTSLHLYPEDPEREVRTISIRGMDIDAIHDLLDDLAAEGVAISAGYLEE